MTSPDWIAPYMDEEPQHGAVRFRRDLLWFIYIYSASAPESLKTTRLTILQIPIRRAHVTVVKMRQKMSMLGKYSCALVVSIMCLAATVWKDSTTETQRTVHPSLTFYGERSSFGFRRSRKTFISPRLCHCQNQPVIVSGINLLTDFLWAKVYLHMTEMLIWQTILSFDDNKRQKELCLTLVCVGFEYCVR